MSKVAPEKKRPRLKGRHWLALWLVIFLAAAALIVSRQRSAILTATRLSDLRDRRQALEATLAELRRDIARAQSRDVLVPRMERMGFHLPSDAENIPLRVDTAARTERGAVR